MRSVFSLTTSLLQPTQSARPRSPVAPSLESKSGQEPGEGQALCPALGGGEGCSTPGRGRGCHPARLSGHCWFPGPIRARFPLSEAETGSIPLPCHSPLQGGSSEVTHIFAGARGRGGVGVNSIKVWGRRWDLLTEMPLSVRQRAERPLVEGLLCAGQGRGYPA